MTIDDYRTQFGWSKTTLCKEAHIDMSTLQRAIDGQPIFRSTLGKIVGAFNAELKRRGESQIHYTDLEGVVLAD